MRPTLKTIGRFGGLAITGVGLITLPNDLQEWRKVLSGDFLSWALIALGLLIFAGSIFGERLRPYLGRSSTHIKGRTLTASDLMTMTDGTPMIVGRTFENCRFQGPMVLMIGASIFGEGTQFNFANQFEKEGVFWHFAQNVNIVQGCIWLTNCQFTGCTFDLVGLGVNDELEAQLRPILGVNGGTQEATSSPL